MKTTIHQRFESLIKALEISPYNFAAKIDVKSALVYNIINERNAPSFGVLEKICITFPTINMNWLLTGKGKMFLTDNDLSPDAVTEGIEVMEKLKYLEQEVAKLKKSSKRK